MTDIQEAKKGLGDRLVNFYKARHPDVRYFINPPESINQFPAFVFRTGNIQYNLTLTPTSGMTLEFGVQLALNNDKWGAADEYLSDDGEDSFITAMQSNVPVGGVYSIRVVSSRTPVRQRLFGGLYIVTEWQLRCLT